MKKILKFSSFVLLAAILFGCQVSNNSSHMSSKLFKYKVDVVQHVNTVSLVLPAKDFFIADSANFVQRASRALDLIVGLSSYYPGSLISITGYSNVGYDNRIAKALALERARRVADYLWDSGVATNFIYTDSENKNLDNGVNKALLSDCVLIEMRKVTE